MQPYFVAPMTGESICLNRNRNDGGFEIENRRERAKKLSNNVNFVHFFIKLNIFKP